MRDVKQGGWIPKRLNGALYQKGQRPRSNCLGRLLLWLIYEGNVYWWEKYPDSNPKQKFKTISPFTGISKERVRLWLLLYLQIFVAASHQTRLDTRSKARRPIKVGIKGRGRSGTSRDSNPACQCCSSAHLVQCEPDEASSFTNPNVGPGTYAS